MAISITPEDAEILALEALGWLAGDPEALERFLQLSGLDGAELRASAGSPETGAAILDFLLRNEELLLRFCADAPSDPQAVRGAWTRLGGTF